MPACVDLVVVRAVVDLGVVLACCICGSLADNVVEDEACCPDCVEWVEETAWFEEAAFLVVELVVELLAPRLCVQASYDGARVTQTITNNVKYFIFLS